MSYQVDEANRRPIKSRRWPFAQRLTHKLASLGVTPNAISTAGMFVAILAGLAFAFTSRTNDSTARILWWLGAVGVQLRLLANLLDGMVAVHTKKASSLGEVFNEVPDRISDAAILIGLGCAALSNPTLGACAAGAAILTAYVRAFGASLDLGQDFSGPMAKPHRMFVVTLAALYMGSSPTAWHTCQSFSIPIATLGIVLVGSLVTAGRRLRHLMRQLQIRS